MILPPMILQGLFGNPGRSLRGDSFLPRMKHGLNTDQDKRQGIGKEAGDEEVEAADGKAGQKTFATDETRSRPEARIRFTPSFQHLTLFFFALFAVLIRV